MVCNQPFPEDYGIIDGGADHVAIRPVRRGRTMTIIPSPQPGLIICDDLPADYVRFLYGNRIDRETMVFSRSDALRGSGEPS